MTERTGGDSKRLGLMELGMIVGLLTNFSGLIWGAATLSESVKNLKDTVLAISSTMNNAVNVLNNQTSEVAVLKYRVQTLEVANATRSGSRQ